MTMKMKDSLDATILRKVLRLVHCLQKERGASCAYYASGSEYKKVSIMMPARQQTDKALDMMICDERNEIPVQTTLEKIRNMLDPSGRRINGSPTGFHRILVCFNTLISTVVHEYILRHTARQRSLLTQDSSSPAPKIPKVHSHHALHELKEETHRRMHSTFENSSSLLSTSDPFYHSMTRQMRRKAPPTSTLLPSPTSGDDSDEMSGEHSKQVSFDPKDDDGGRVVRLLNLLDLFVRLKESTGVERAILSSILAVDQIDLQLLFVNDLVLEVENQRRMMEELFKLRNGELRNLMQELVTMSPVLQELQQRILRGFDMEDHAFVDAEKLWDALTTYINKLHSVELLIVEEIECSAAPNHPVNSIANPYFAAAATDSVFKSLLGVSEDLPNADLRARIEAMSATDVKQLLLSVLPSSNGEHISEVAVSSKHGRPRDPSPTRVEDLLKELSCAPTAKEWEIDLYEIRFMRRIGQGTAGTTYLADWNGLKVAVKVASITEMGLEGWRTEIQSLQKLHHPNIIRLLGSVYHPNPLTFCLVLEYCEAGDLSIALQRVTPKNFFFRTAISIAKGMHYLHNRGIIHRDIKPSNVLIDGNVSLGQFSVKVTDFGVATESTHLRERTAETGTYLWMAPEVIRHEAYSKTADVYSFAIVMWQLITREGPFADRSQIEAAAGVAMESARPPFPEGTPKDIAELIKACWSDNPEARPPFDQISTRLQEIESSSITDEERKWLDAPLGHPAYKKAKKTESKQHHLETELLVKQRQQTHDEQQAHGKIKKGRPASGMRKLFSRKSGYF